MKNENMEKVIEKIKKVLELSKNNPSQAEAQAAALKAQKMMAEYHITMKELDTDDKEDMTENKVKVGMGNKWKYMLGNIIAKNFRVEKYYSGKDTLCFYGYESDVEIASMTFEYLYETGKKAANRYYNQRKKEVENVGGYFSGKGLKNTFLLGYCEGIKEVLDRQCTALMIVEPPEVKEAYDTMARERGFRVINSKGISCRNDSKARQAGVYEGRSAMSGRKLEMA